MSCNVAARRSSWLTAYGLRLTIYCLLLTGCATLPHRGPFRLPQPLPEELRAYYDYPSPLRDAVIRLVEESHGVRVFLVQHPLSVPAGVTPTEPVVEFEWFVSPAPGRRPAILMNPILGGDYPLERGICHFFARHGFHAALVHRKTLKISPEYPVSRVELLLRQGVLRIRQIVDWMQVQERVDPARLGSFGISMGGIAGVLSAAVEPRLRCHVVALAGGSLPDILVASPDKLLATQRQRYLALNHMDRAALEQQLRDAIRTDPVRLAPYVDSQRVFMIIALFDRTIGRANALRLWHALGEPRAAFLPLGHYTAYLTLPYLKSASLRFFQKTLQ